MKARKLFFRILTVVLPLLWLAISIEAALLKYPALIIAHFFLTFFTIFLMVVNSGFTFKTEIKHAVETLPRVSESPGAEKWASILAIIATPFFLGMLAVIYWTVAKELTSLIEWKIAISFGLFFVAFMSPFFIGGAIRTWLPRFASIFTWNEHLQVKF